MDENGIVRKIGIAPPCFQNSHPSIYRGVAGSMRNVEFWAREGGKPIVLSGNLDFCETLWNRYAEVAKQAGRDLRHEDVAAFFFFFIMTGHPPNSPLFPTEPLFL